MSVKFHIVPATLLAAVFALTAMTGTPAFSASENDSTTIITPKCKKGKVWNRKKKRCVKIKKSSMLDDENIYLAGRDLAMRGEFEDAIQVLSFAHNKNDPRILNYLGYSHRKAGRIDVGLGFYKIALRIDPDYTLVREYMGEAFLQKGDLAGAKNQLVEIENRCGTKCREYTELAVQIDSFLAKKAGFISTKN